MRESIVELTTTVPESTDQSDVDPRRTVEALRDGADLDTNVLDTVPLRPWMKVKIAALRPRHLDPGQA